MLELEDARQVRALRRRQHRVLQLLELVGDLIDDREVVVDDAVGDQVVDEVEAALGGGGVDGDPPPHLVDRGDRAEVHRHQVALAEERVQLVQLELGQRRAVAREALGHQEQVVAVLLELGPLIVVRAVFDRQRMEVEPLAQELELRLVREAQVDPPQRARRRRRDAVRVLGRLGPPGGDVEDAEHRDRWYATSPARAGSRSPLAGAEV